MRMLPIISLAFLCFCACSQAAPEVNPNPEVSFKASLSNAFKQQWTTGEKVSVVSIKDGSVATVDTFTAMETGTSVRFGGRYTGAAQANLLVVYPALEKTSGQVYESAPLYGNTTGFFRAVQGTGYILFAPKENMVFQQQENAVSTVRNVEFLMGGSSAQALFDGSVSLNGKTSAIQVELDASALGQGEKVESLTLSVDQGKPFTSYRGSMSLDASKDAWLSTEAQNSFQMELGGFAPGNKLTVFVPVFPNESGASLSGDKARTLHLEVKSAGHSYRATHVIPANVSSYKLEPGKEIHVSGTLSEGPYIPPVEEPVIKSVTKILEKGPSAVCIDGNVLYVGGSGFIYSMDISNPRQPRQIGSLTFPGSVRQITAYNGKVIISARETGVWVFNAQDPANLSLISRFDGIELSTGIDMAGDCIFVGERQSGVEFVDARNLSKPQHIRIMKTPESQTVFYSNGYLYSGEWAAAQVSIFNAKDLSNIRLVKTINLQGFGDGLWVSGNRLYASTGHHHRNETPSTVNGDGHGVEIWDVTNPENPVFISRTEFDIFYLSGADWWLNRPSGDGKTLFCGDVYNGLYVVDIADERNPQIIHHWEPLGNTPQEKKNAVSSLALADGVAYVAVSNEGLYMMESSRAKPSPRDRGVSPANLQARYQYNTPSNSHFNAWLPDQRGQVKSAAVYGDALFVGAGDAGLYTVKKDASGKPYTVARLDIPFAGGVAVQGDKLYVSRGHLGLGVYRIAQDLSLTEITLIKQELYPSNTKNQFSYWVSVPNDKYVVNGARSNGYHFLAVGGTSAAPTYTFKRQYSLNLNYNRYISEKTSSEGILAYATRSGLVWIDLSSTASVPAPEVRSDLKNSLTEGATLYKNNQFLLTRDKTLRTIAPGGSTILATSAANDAFTGIPRWESGDNVLICNFVHQYISKVNTANFESPTLLFSESTEGYPEPGLFWNGKCVVPCGYQGLLIEK